MARMIVLALTAVFLWGLGAAQDDFTVPIKCYECKGLAENSSCADPIDKSAVDEVKVKHCEQGVCLKWTKYKNKKLEMIRTCSADDDLNFQLTMIDGVCRTERSGNGYLCMCGSNKCNSANSRHFVTTWRPLLALTLLLMCYILVPEWSRRL